MAYIYFKCVSCNKKLKTDDEYILGKRIRCPRCSEATAVPPAKEEAAVDAVLDDLTMPVGDAGVAAEPEPLSDVVEPFAEEEAAPVDDFAEEVAPFDEVAEEAALDEPSLDDLLSDLGDDTAEPAPVDDQVVTDDDDWLAAAEAEVEDFAVAEEPEPVMEAVDDFAVAEEPEPALDVVDDFDMAEEPEVVDMAEEPEPVMDMGDEFAVTEESTEDFDALDVLDSFDLTENEMAPAESHEVAEEPTVELSDFGDFDMADADATAEVAEVSDDFDILEVADVEVEEAEEIDLLADLGYDDENN